MSATPPPGYGIWAATIQTVGSTHDSVITCGFNNSSALTAAFANTALRTAMVTAGGPFVAANMANGFNLVKTYVLINTGVGLYVDTNLTTVTGIQAITTPSINNAIVIKKNTILAGRQFRGRFFAPPMSLAEADLSIAGIIAGVSLTNTQSRWLTFYNALVTQGIPPVLLHEAPLVGSTPAPTPVTSFTVTPLVGTIKRRIRS